MKQDATSEMRAILEHGIAESLFTGAQLVISNAEEDIFQLCVGKTKKADDPKLSFVPPADIRYETLFDIASVTKPLATAALVMQAVDEGLVHLNQKLVTIEGVQVPLWLLGNTIADLLSHHTMLQAWLDFQGNQPRRESHEIAVRFVQKQIEESDARKDDKTWCYSDLGYILLGFILEALYQKPLDVLFCEKITSPLGLSSRMMYCPLHHVMQKDIAATCHLGKQVIQGHPDDSNARALTHIAGHAGVFATAGAISAYIRALLNGRFPCSQDIIQTFIEYHQLGTPYALGWDRPTDADSLSGRLPGEHVIGHLGFTGCSVWVDLDTKISVTLLTNRTHVNQEPKSIAQLRRDIYQLSWNYV